MAWSSSWKVIVTAVVVLLSRSSFGQSRCAEPTLTVTSLDEAKSAIKCATVVDGANTLQHSLHIISTGEEIPFTVSFGEVKVVIGEILLSTSASVSSRMDIEGAKLENITGGIKIDSDLTPSDRRQSFTRRISISFPTLRSLSLFEVDSLDEHDTVTEFTSDVTTTLRIVDTRNYSLGILDDFTQPSEFVFMRNTLPNYGDGLVMGRNLVLPLRQVSGRIEFSGNPHLAKLSIPHLDSAGAIILSANPSLGQVDLPITRLGSITVEANAFAQLRLPDLQTLGGSSTFSDLAFVDLASLHNTTEPGTDFFFSENTFTSLDLPALETLATGLSIRENPFLNHTNLANLRRVEGSLTIKGNPGLLTFSANRLVVVKGSVRLAGSFTNIEMYRLKEVAGDFEVGGDESMDCSWFDEQFRGKVLVVRGKYSCIRGYLASAGTGRPTGEEQDGLLSTGAKAGIGVGGAVGGILVIGFSVRAFLAWRKKAMAGSSTGAETGKPEMDGSGRADPPMHELGVVPVSEPVAHQLDISPRPRTPELADTRMLAELA